MLKEIGYGATLVCVKAGLTGISGAATTYTTSATTLQYCVQGKAATKAQVSGGTTPVTDAVTAAAFVGLTASKGCVFVWGLNLAGTQVVAQGSIGPLDASGAFIDAPNFPMLPDTFCPIAYQVVKAGSTTVGTWTFSSSNWNATGLTHTVVDVFTLPERPQIS